MNELSTKQTTTQASLEHPRGAHRQFKFFNIIVNGRMRIFSGKKISFSQVLELSHNAATARQSKFYRISYQQGEESQPEGILERGESVSVKPGMIFRVEPGSGS